MHWAYETAQKIIDRNPGKKEYVCASGISPSGSVHIGNYREFVTTYFIAKALSSMGKNVRMLFSWDEFDALRKLPKNIPGLTEDMLRRPLALLPDVVGGGKFKGFADYFENEFESAMGILQMNEIKLDFIREAKEYLSGRYTQDIIHALKFRKEIYDILMEFKTQEAEEEGRENYYPINFYCGKCGKDTTTINGVNKGCNEINYTCKCGNTETVNLETYKNVKLVWRVDWPMRWKTEGVDFEPGGIDHSAPGGSYDTGVVLAKKIFNYTAPLYHGYAWIGIRGTGNMHSSSGNNITPGQLLNIYEPEIIRWLFAKYTPSDPFDFDFSETIIRHYSEFDKLTEAYYKNELNEYDQKVFDLCLFKNRNKAPKVSFGTLSNIAPLVDFNADAVKSALSKAGIEFDENSYERLNKVKYWLTNYMPEKIYKLLTKPNTGYAKTLNEREVLCIKQVYEYLKTDAPKTEKDIQQKLYDLINDPALSKKDNVAVQQKYFKNFYNLLFGRDDGPRLYLFFAAADKNSYLKLLDIK